MPGFEECGIILADLGAPYHKGLTLRGDSLQRVRDKYGLPSIAQVDYLARGGTARIYRVFDGKEVYVLKGFDPDFSPESVAEDARALNYFGGLKSCQGGENFRVVEVKKIIGARRALQLADVRGQELEAFLRHLDKTDPPKAKKVRDLYNKRLGAVAAEVRGLTGSQVGEKTATLYNLDSYTMRVPEFSQTLTLPALNIVVNPESLEMTIVDGL